MFGKRSLLKHLLGIVAASCIKDSLARVPSSPTWSRHVWRRASGSIDAEGFLSELYDVIDGLEEEGATCFELPAKMRVRQVPGDGSCLFHSITASLSVDVNGTHHSMDVEPLLQQSDLLRNLAVDILEGRPERVLFLQGAMDISIAELLDAAAQQQNMTSESYCKSMRQRSVWGGGPEILALANELKTPIHVYELNVGAGPGGPRWQLRRIACFGSPRFDRRARALHILSADSRFPEVRPGEHMPTGNHFLACFPEPAQRKLPPWRRWFRWVGRARAAKGAGGETDTDGNVDTGTEAGRAPNESGAIGAADGGVTKGGVIRPSSLPS